MAPNPNKQPYERIIVDSDWTPVVPRSERRKKDLSTECKAAIMKSVRFAEDMFMTNKVLGCLHIRDRIVYENAQFSWE